MELLRCGCIVCGEDDYIQVSNRTKKLLGTSILYVCPACGKKADAYLELTKEQSVLVGELKYAPDFAPNRPLNENSSSIEWAETIFGAPADSLY